MPAMKTGILNLLVLLATALDAAAWSGPLSCPQYYAPKGCPVAVMNQVGAALNRKDCKFVSGRFFSLSASYSYSGNTFALNSFLKGLSECPGVQLTIRKTKDYGGAGDWRVYTHLTEKRFMFLITVNLNSERIVAEGIRIPSLTGPELKLVARKGAAAQPIRFSQRLELSTDQEALLRLARRFERNRGKAVGPTERGDELADLKRRMGKASIVRHARPNELVIERQGESDIAVIFNPTDDSLVFNVAIKGDEVLAGSQKMSVAHESWLPPNGACKCQISIGVRRRCVRRRSKCASFLSFRDSAPGA
jgi:hypothetical protein